MTRGRRPPPTYLRLLQGNPQRRPLNTNEPQPEVPAEFPEPPPHIEGYAHDEWYRIGPELHRMRLLTVADLKIFEFYCQSYGRWRDADCVRHQHGAQIVIGLRVTERIECDARH